MPTCSCLMAMAATAVCWMQDDDDDDNQFALASSTDSGLRMTLPAGTYTIEATTYNPRITETFTLTVSGLETVTPPATDGDYDIDNDGLIEISVLEQLNAIRWDLDGDGIVDSSITDSQPYLAAFPDAVTGMGCPSNECNGYELSRDLDFLDTASYVLRFSEYELDTRRRVAPH